MVDIDLGDFFINLTLHSRLLLYSAVDLMAFKTRIKEAFPRMLEGFELENRVMG